MKNEVRLIDRPKEHIKVLENGFKESERKVYRKRERNKEIKKDTQINRTKESLNDRFKNKVKFKENSLK